MLQACVNISRVQIWRDWRKMSLLGWIRYWKFKFFFFKICSKRWIRNLQNSHSYIPFKYSVNIFNVPEFFFNVLLIILKVFSLSSSQVWANLDAVICFASTQQCYVISKGNYIYSYLSNGCLFWTSSALFVRDMNNTCR